MQHGYVTCRCRCRCRYICIDVFTYFFIVCIYICIHKVHDMTRDYVTLSCIILHYIALHRSSVQCSALPIPLHSTPLHSIMYITLHTYMYIDVHIWLYMYIVYNYITIPTWWSIIVRTHGLKMASLACTRSLHKHIQVTSTYVFKWYYLCVLFQCRYVKQKIQNLPA